MRVEAGHYWQVLPIKYDQSVPRTQQRFASNRQFRPWGNSQLFVDSRVHFLSSWVHGLRQRLLLRPTISPFRRVGVDQMKRIALVITVCILSSGCRAPMPNINSFGPYGATRVPPPGTSGYGTQQPYYAPPTSVAPPTSPTSGPVGTGFRDSTQNRWSNILDPSSGPIAKNNTWAPTRPISSKTPAIDLDNVDVALASHNGAIMATPSLVVDNNQAVRIVSTPTTSTLPQLRGMVVNDATRVGEPRQFVPSGRVVDISELPNAPVTQSASASRTAQSSSSQAAVSSGGWKTRTTTLKVAGS